MLQRSARTWLAALVAVVSVCASAAVASADSLTVVNGDQTKQKITLEPGTNGQLAGNLKLVVHNNTESKARLVVHYYPSGDGNAATAGALRLAGVPPEIDAHALSDLEFVASLPASSSPADLGGILELQLEPHAATATPLNIAVEGIAPPLSGVAIVPATLPLHSVSWWGPLSRAHNAGARIELRGPGVPSLFRESPTLSTFVLLRSGSGHEIHATLDAHAPKQGGAVAQGTVTVRGALTPGTYTTTVPLSDRTAGGPQLALSLKASDSFIWALLAVGLGAFIGGGVYLASKRKRRKDLLEHNLRDALTSYQRRRAEFASAGGPLPLWNVTDLGPEETWYDRKWTALPQIAGVQGIGAQIYWARDEADLETAQAAAVKVLERLARWLKIAQGEELSTLQAAAALKPADPPLGPRWTGTRTCFDSSLLLRRLRENEPPDDDTVRVLLERIVRQARWHALFAKVWHMRSTIAKDIGQNEGRYTNIEKDALDAIDLAKLDSEAPHEDQRTADQQLALETQLEALKPRLVAIYKGPENLEDLEVPGPHPAQLLGALTAEQARSVGTPYVRLPAEVAPITTDIAESPLLALRPPPKTPRDQLRGAVTGAPGWLTALTVRDFLWSFVIVIATLCAYVPTFYGPSWGSLGDYGTAFLAGFLGKVVVNWAALPAFTSIALRFKAPG
jgi:hypothetical protein